MSVTYMFTLIVGLNRLNGHVGVAIGSVGTCRSHILTVQSKEQV